MRRKHFGFSELTPALAVSPDEIRVTEAALGGGAIHFAPRPQIAPCKAQENRALSRLDPSPCRVRKHSLTA